MLLFDSKVRCEFIKPETEGLLVIVPQTNLNTFEWIKENKSLLEDYLVKFR